MDKNSELKNMSAPAVNSGKYAGDTILAAGGASETASEKGSNELKEYTTPAQPKSNIGGRAKH